MHVSTLGGLLLEKAIGGSASLAGRVVQVVEVGAGGRDKECQGTCRCAREGREGRRMNGKELKEEARDKAKREGSQGRTGGSSREEILGRTLADVFGSLES
jgi:hypothetical protein